MDDAMRLSILNFQTGVLTLVIEFSGRITGNMTDHHHITPNGEKKSFQHSLNLLRVSFHLLMNQKLKRPLLELDVEEGDIALSNMLKSIVISVKKLVFGP
ncbi:MAG: hypothetical protein ACLUSV_08635 [Streptococcus sp.]